MPNLLVVGIGNPGDLYKNNRHNLGFQAIDDLSKYYKVPLDYDKKKSVFGIKRVRTNLLILLKPQTFANLSGESVLYLASFLKVEIKNVLIVFDDPFTNFGEMYYFVGEKTPEKVTGIKNGAVQSLVESLNSGSFSTIGVGIGPLHNEEEIEEFCLSDFAEDERRRLPDIFQKVRKYIDSFIDDAKS